MGFRFRSQFFSIVIIAGLLFAGYLIRIATYPNCLLIKDSDMRLDQEGEPMQIRCRHRRPLVIEGKNGFEKARMKFLARYRITGKVVAVQQIRDRGSWMSAADVGIAWGKMADPDVDEYVRYGQRGRFLYYFPRPGLPVSIKYLQRHTSNNHILTTSNSMLNVVKNLIPGDEVTFDGYLVKLSGTGRRGHRFSWESSMRRTDTGDGACEIMYIERIWVNGHYYE